MKKLILLSTVFSLAVSSVAVAESNIIATVNGQAIYNKELTRNLDAIPNYDKLPTEQQEQIKTKILTAITKLDAVVQEAKKLKIQDNTKYQEQLADFQKQLMYSTLLENHIDSAVTDKKLKEYYDEHKKEYIQNKAKAKHILVNTKAEAEEVIQKLTAGSKFNELAKEYSIGPSSVDGGNLGWFDKEDMVADFSDAVFALDKGDFTKEPVKTQFGWHVILLEDKSVDVPALFDDVKDEIKEKVMQDEVESYLNSIIEKADIVIND
jgi:peptidyl-prolyl cis-trans isomerase C